MYLTFPQCEEPVCVAEERETRREKKGGNRFIKHLKFPKLAQKEAKKKKI